MIRKSRKINKMRGSRTVGGGCSKKRRGAGHRGGRGMAGSHKHLWSWIVKYDPKHFGKYGFKRPLKSINEVNTVNLSYLDEKSEQLLEKGLATKENDVIVIDVTDLGYNKVLGQGKLTKPLNIKAPVFSASAERKIQEAGGEALIL
ncbi:uL15m family ribosomal protein [Methanobacterium alcaliphilum]|uniref:uL15m family ribosomal protein n=1 Tax=Methanobacterium alcaliphilum TaxID=392018 RepID=UPI00200A77AB|nr:uL15 family ribosomal protein [Methanobacterium alcaliphilum]MCK9151333.1 50S ribosomal protein L15 [Methanobacterium alcaliphilum]